LPTSLFWVYTYDHYEDWFVLARSSREARDFHENDCGYDLGDARAKLICRSPISFSRNVPCYASWSVLRRCGVKILHKDYPAVFEKDGQRFKEGAIVDDIYTEGTDNIAGLYVLQMRDTEYFKIGITTHLRNRISSLSTANPIRFGVVCFAEVSRPSNLETTLHNVFRKNRQEGEWFVLRTSELKRLHDIVQREVEVSRGRIHLNRFPYEWSRKATKGVRAPSTGQEAKRAVKLKHMSGRSSSSMRLGGD
jgi:Meiotically Up-regulated Gene 113 (MUG113) protein